MQPSRAQQSPAEPSRVLWIFTVNIQPLACSRVPPQPLVCDLIYRYRNDPLRTATPRSTRCNVGTCSRKSTPSPLKTTQDTMGNKHSSPLQGCLDSVCTGHRDCVAFPGDVLYDALWVRPYNLDAPVTPAAVIRPSTSAMVSNAVKCAVQHGASVQARSGGHSYGNYGLGGRDGAVVVDLLNFKDFSMDANNWTASFGAGLRLGELDKKLHDNGRRAIPHGTCPGVGVGGQAVVGGLGPSSRMWGNMVDHILEVEVVTAKGEVQRASQHQNADLFWALRGAGPSFGIVTKLWMRTHPEPDSVVEYTYDISFGDPSLDRRFSSLFIIHPLGAVITGTFYGSQRELQQTGILDRLPSRGSVRLGDWLGSVVHVFESLILQLADVPTHFFSKSLALRRQDLLDRKETDALFDYLDRATPPMVLMFNTEGGAVADVPLNQTSYPHRDKVIIYQSYVIEAFGVSDENKRFLEGVHKRIKRDTPLNASTYAGYVDMAPNRSEAQLAYWGDLLPQLQQIKQNWDPSDVFRNPQSVEPAGAIAASCQSNRVAACPMGQ
ncbi:FAD binding domain-containing protein [Hirsutella rhossiliensis]|uniref:FAD binding domain-containing protein n=1 Tax=Hirsutella rhossiliensis TaxID=111463 RepID=A0A9P8SMG6_9HYPO|nr:FAD binding domain-containing protein [Hirsutella rhossiliensis]KAH0966111.1 FAD binding domain-containing protein [Hirsutella rhossiliensis]